MFAFLSPARNPLRLTLDEARTSIVAATRAIGRTLWPARRGVMMMAAMGALAACEPVDTSLGRSAPATNTSAPVPVALLVARIG